MLSKKYRLSYLPLFYEDNSQHNNRIRVVGDIKRTLKSGILRTAKETSPEILCGSMSPSFCHLRRFQLPYDLHSFYVDFTE